MYTWQSDRVPTHPSLFGTNFWKCILKWMKAIIAPPPSFSNRVKMFCDSTLLACSFGQDWVRLTDEANELICLPTCIYPLTAHYRSFERTISYCNGQWPSCFLFWKRGKRVAVVARDQREITLTTIMNQSDERTESYDMHFCAMHAS